MSSERRERLLWTVAIFTFVATDAIGFQLRGALLPSLERDFQASTALLGLVSTAGTVGFVVSVLAVGVVAGRIDIRKALLAGAAVVGVTALLTGLAPVFAVFLGALFVRGVATGPFRALDRAVLSHLFPDGRSKVFNLYALVWAVGATAGPLVATAALAAGDWRYAYALVGAGFLLSAALLVRLELPESVNTERAITLAELRTVLRRPAVAGMAVALVLSGAVEGTLFTWLPYFAAERLPETAANLLLSTLLAAYIPGRLVYSYVTDRLDRSLDVVLLTSTAGIPLLVALVFVAEGPWLFATVFAMGLVVSAAFPTLSAFGVGAAPEFSGPVNAVATAAGYVGIAVAPPLVGALAGRVGLTAALGVLPAVLVAVVVVVGATRLFEGRALGG